MSALGPFLKHITASVLSNYTLFVSQLKAHTFCVSARLLPFKNSMQKVGKVRYAQCLISENEVVFSMKRSILSIKLLLSVPQVPLQDDDSSDCLLQDSVWLLKSASGPPCACTVH